MKRNFENLTKLFVYSVFWACGKKRLWKKTKWKNIENGKTYLEDLELNPTAATNLKHPRATLVSQGAFWAYLHGVKSTMNSEKQILKSTLYIAVVITYTIIQDWSVMAFFLILYFLPKLFLNGYQIYHSYRVQNHLC